MTDIKIINDTKSLVGIRIEMVTIFVSRRKVGRVLKYITNAGIEWKRQGITQFPDDYKIFHFSVPTNYVDETHSILITVWENQK